MTPTPTSTHGTITTLKTVRGGFSVWVGATRVLTASTGVVATVGLRVGGIWNADVAARAEHAAKIETIRAAAMRLLKTSERSKAALAARLAQKGFAAADIAAAMDDMERAGVIDDARAAATAAHAATRKPTSSTAVEAKLAMKGFDVATRRAAVGETGATDNAAAARAVLEPEMKRFSKLDKAAAARRAFGLLARRGFDEQTAEDVVRDMIGIDEGWSGRMT